MFWIVTGNKSQGDKDVTGVYLSIIKEGIIKSGNSCELLQNDGQIKKNDYLVFDECKIAFKYILKGYKNIIIWVQGVVPEEALLKGYSRFRYYIHSYFERIVLSKAKLIFFCSESMKKHYTVKYKIDFSNRSLIMPCFNELAIQSDIFDNINKYENNTFLYAGSLHEWQCFDTTAKVYKMLEEHLGSNSKFYVYTPERDKALAIIKEQGIRNYEIDYLPANRLSEALKNIKYGFVLRDNSIVNQVATPTKISNYLANGIIPIYSDCLESFHQHVKKTKGPAIVCNIDNLEKGINNIIDSTRKEIENDAMKKWVQYTFNTYYNKDKYVEAITQKIRVLMHN